MTDLDNAYEEHQEVLQKALKDSNFSHVKKEKRRASVIADPTKKAREGAPKTVKRIRLLTQETADRIYALKRLGLSDVKTCEYAPVQHDTFQRWKGLGKQEYVNRACGLPPNEEKETYLNFYVGYTIASGWPVEKYIEVIQKAVIDGGNAELGLKMLERQFPEEFAPTKRFEVSGRDGKPIKYEAIDETKLDVFRSLGMQESDNETDDENTYFDDTLDSDDNFEGDSEEE